MKDEGGIKYVIMMPVLASGGSSCHTELGMAVGGAGVGEGEDEGFTLDLLRVLCLLSTYVEMSSKNRRR